MENKVYLIKNTVNDKRYYGITKCSIKKRWYEHKCRSKSSNSHLYRAIRLYGIDNFSIHLINIFHTEEEMYNREIELIARYKTNDRRFGYNNSIGGESSSLGKKLSVESRNKISTYQKNRKRKPHSEETKKNMSKAAKGRDMSEVIAASVKARRGKPSKRATPVILNGKTEYRSITEAAKETGLGISSIHNNLKGLSKTTKIGIWKYK